jgi:membrane protease YdiL (CAAX protease family)
MEKTETPAAGSKPSTGSGPIASRVHLAGFLAIMAALTVVGFLAQHTATAGGAAPSGQLAGHSVAIRVYFVVILMDWALFYYCWAGVHRAGGNLQTLSAGRWTSGKDIAIDLAIALPFWGLWEGAAFGVRALLGPDSAKSVDSLLPQSLLEILVWTATCITAGFCEEIAFRGYLQRQFRALGGNVALAVIGQGVVFGIAHSYQGWKSAIVITVLGILYGALFAWRGNLRANMISHAWSDFWEGWLKFIVWR